MKKRMLVAALAVLVAISAYAETTNLFVMVQTGTARAVQDAINNGASVNASDIDGLTPLMRAARDNKNAEVISILLKAGADIEARDKRPGIGGTALIWAAASNENPEVATTLVRAGANRDVRTEDGRTPLIWAAESNPNPEMIIVLLHAGVDAKARDKSGMTAYDYARYNLKGTDALKKLEEASQ